MAEAGCFRLLDLGCSDWAAIERQHRPEYVNAIGAKEALRAQPYIGHASEGRGMLRQFHLYDKRRGSALLLGDHSARLTAGAWESVVSESDRSPSSPSDSVM